MAKDDRDNLEVIQAGLQQIGGWQKFSGSSQFIVCPFHGDTDPSMGVYLGIDSKIPLGFFHCMACGEKGHWNKLAEKLNLDKIKEWKKEKNAADILDKEIENDLLGTKGMTLKTVFKTMNCEEADRWPKDVEWRGFSGKLIRKVGGFIINDRHNDNIAVLFPIAINGKIKGAVKALYKRNPKTKLAYITMQGDWAKKYALFPYHYAKHLIEKHNKNYVVLVEGPRDALRLIENDIPALAILGSKVFSELKALLVIDLGVDIVYVMPDNDEGGNGMWKAVKKAIEPKHAVELKRIKLPKKKNKHGDLIKMDPFNMPEPLLNELIDLIDG